MTLRRLWLVILVLVSVVAIAVNAIVLTFLTDRYFSDYLKESYNLHVNQITDYVSSAMQAEDISYSQMAIELESHLYDPIIGIKVYEPSGNLLVDVNSDYSMNDMMDNMMGGMMGRFSDVSSEEVHRIDIEVDGRIIAVVNITLHSIAEDSYVARRFQQALFTNSLYSVGIAIIIAFVVGIITSQRMSRSLKDTERLASDIQLGNENNVKPTRIKEVNSIRDSLVELDVRLKLKQKTRKALIDQLLHQTRTPLTILKSHIEAMEDGIIDADEKELEVCRSQIEDITFIISNMSSMIDAEKDTDELRIENFEIGSLLKQIQQGLSAQFKKKRIILEVVSNQSVQVRTDKNKLSQSIYNLLMNAYKYTNEDGAVRVSYIVVDDRLIIKVQDTGLGISDSETSKVFDAYYRSPKVANSKGEGIGLYIVKENIERIQGNIDLESKLNVGSTFTIDIPVNLIKE